MGRRRLLLSSVVVLTLGLTVGLLPASAAQEVRLTVSNMCIAESSDAYHGFVTLTNGQTGSRESFPIGDDNRFQDGPVDRGQPEFIGLVQQVRAHITWPTDPAITPLVWTLGGADGLEIVFDPSAPGMGCSLEELSLDVSAHCAVSTKPEGYGSLWSVDADEGEVSGGFLTTGYYRFSNASEHTWLLPFGAGNRFSPGSPLRGQPDVIAPGDHWIAVSWNHIRIPSLTLQLAGSSIVAEPRPGGTVPQCLGLDPDDPVEVTLLFPDGEPGVPGPQGPEGPAGVTGPAGPAGPAGLQGRVEVVRSSAQPLDAANDSTAEVRCPTGTVLIGGGAELAPAGADAVLRASYPDGRSWHVRYGPGVGTVTVTATCIAAS